MYLLVMRLEEVHLGSYFLYPKQNYQNHCILWKSPQLIHVFTWISRESRMFIGILHLFALLHCSGIKHQEDKDLILNHEQLSLFKQSVLPKIWDEFIESGRFHSGVLFEKIGTKFQDQLRVGATSKISIVRLKFSVVRMLWDN